MLDGKLLSALSERLNNLAVARQSVDGLLPIDLLKNRSVAAPSSASNVSSELKKSPADIVREGMREIEISDNETAEAYKSRLDCNPGSQHKRVVP